MPTASRLVRSSTLSTIGLLLAIACASAALVQPARAATDPPTSPSSPIFRNNDTAEHLEDNLRFRTRGWTLELQGHAWLAAARGDVRLPGGSTFQVEDLNFDDASIAPTVEARLRFGNWQVEALAAFFRYDDTSSASRAADLGNFTVAPGDRLDIRLNATNLQLRAGRRVWTANLTDAKRQPIQPGVPAPSSGVNIDLELFAGVRAMHYDLRIRPDAGGIEASVNEFWVQPTAGLGLRIDFDNRATVDVIGNIGGWYDSSATAFSWDVAASIGYAWTNNIQTEFGYRYIRNNYDKGRDDFELAGSIAGLFAGLTIRF